MQELKLRILEEIIATTRSAIETAETGRKTAEKESRFHKGAMQSRYDTFKEEAQYLAGAFEKNLSELRQQLGTLEVLRNNPPKIEHGSLYALIKLEDCNSGERLYYFLLPAGGGTEHEDDGKTITVISLGTPISSALIGKHEDDEVTVRLKNSKRELLILSIE